MRSKYRVDQSPEGREKRTFLGRVYDSQAERKYAERLDVDPEVVWWIRQPAFDLGEDTRYRADFLYQNANGDVIVVDVKGYETSSFRKIRKLWAKYGQLQLRIVKNGSTVDTIIPGD